MREFKKEEREKQANNQRDESGPRQRSVKLMDDDQQQYPSTATEQKMRKRAVTTTVAVNLSSKLAEMSKYDAHKAVQKARAAKDSDDPDTVSEGGGDDSDKDIDFRPTDAEIENAEVDDDEAISEADENVTMPPKNKKKKKAGRIVASDSSYRPDKSHLSEKQKRAKKKRESNAAGADVILNTPIVPSPTHIRSSTVMIESYNDYYNDHRQPSSSHAGNNNETQNDGETEYEDTAGDLMALQDLTPDLQSGVRDLLASTDPADDNMKILLAVVLQRTSGIKKQADDQAAKIDQLKNQVRILIGLKGRNKLFFILKGDSGLFAEMVNTIKRYIQFPLFHMKQLAFLEKILERFPFLFFVVVSHSDS
jgi:hypothetical protein